MCCGAEIVINAASIFPDFPNQAHDNLETNLDRVSPRASFSEMLATSSMFDDEHDDKRGNILLKAN